MSRAQLIASLGLVGLACTPTKPKQEEPVIIEAVPVREPEPEPKPEPPTTPPGPTPAIAQPAKPPKPPCTPTPFARGSLEFVPEARLEMPTHIDPSARFGAVADAFGGCAVWELDSGVTLGEFRYHRDSGACVRWPGGIDPCTSWPEIETLVLWPAHHSDVIGAREASNEAIRITSQSCKGQGFAGDASRFAFECPPARKVTHARRYVALSISPDGERFVAARSDDALELRSTTDGELIAELSLTHPKPPARELVALGLTWSARGLPVVVSKRGPWCRDLDVVDCAFEPSLEKTDEFVWELRRWDQLDAPAKSTTLNDGDDPPTEAYVEDLSVDPLGLWLFVTSVSGYSHDNRSARSQLPLTPEAAQRSFDVADEWYEDNGFADAGPWGPPLPDDGEWYVGTRTARVWAGATSDYDGEGFGSDALSWTSFELTPTVTHVGGPSELASDSHVEQQSLELFGVADGMAIFRWSHCFAADDEAAREELDDLGPDGCRGYWPIPRECEPLGLSDDREWVLASCEGDVKLIAEGADTPSEVLVASKADGTPTTVLGRHGLAIATTVGGTHMMRPNGDARVSVPGIDRLVRAKLDAEVDRAVGQGSAGLTVLDLESLTPIVTLAPAALGLELEHLAFAPNGQQLAISDGRQIAIVTLAGGTVTRWDAGGVVGLAWRQDSAVLFSGRTRELPELAWDPARGGLTKDQPDPAMLDRLATADLDPSWRWAFDGDQTIVRTIDGLALYIVDDDVVVSETGLYDGSNGFELYVRVGGLPASEVISLDRLPSRLRHGDLLDDFLAGKPLPRPQLTQAELEGLKASSTEVGSE